jgi:zinc D-Ala-D-Ala carboxypeptidase
MLSILTNTILQFYLSQQPLMSDQRTCTPAFTQQMVTYDLWSDASLQRYVSPKDGLHVAAYKPKDLVSIEGIPHVVVQNNQGELRREAAEALTRMAHDFATIFSGKDIVIVSSYRGFAYQEKLLEGYIKKLWETLAYGLSALPGHSEHQLGLAIDVFSASSDADFRKGFGPYFDRMRAYAHTYGWTQSYQKGRDIDGYVVEPWHWRYVGVELATYLSDNQMTFGEYVGLRRAWEK